MNSSFLQLLMFAALITLISCGKDSDDNQPSSDDNQPNKVVSCFTYSKKQIDVIDFSSSCSENASSYQWEFGDGSTSINPNPTHTYNSHGTYEVTLVVAGEQGSSNTSTQTIIVEKNVKSCFTYSVNEAIISFDPSCSENAIQYVWDFGNGSPVLTYPNPTFDVSNTVEENATYNITLVVYNQEGVADTSEQIITFNCVTCTNLTSYCGVTQQELDDFCDDCLSNGGACD